MLLRLVAQLINLGFRGFKLQQGVINGFCKVFAPKFRRFVLSKGARNTLLCLLDDRQPFIFSISIVIAELSHFVGKKQWTQLAQG